MLDPRLQFAGIIIHIKHETFVQFHMHEIMSRYQRLKFEGITEGSAYYYCAYYFYLIIHIEHGTFVQFHMHEIMSRYQRLKLDIIFTL